MKKQLYHIVVGVVGVVISTALFLAPSTITRHAIAEGDALVALIETRGTDEGMSATEGWVLDFRNRDDYRLTTRIHLLDRLLVYERRAGWWYDDTLHPSQDILFRFVPLIGYFCVGARCLWSILKQLLRRLR